MPLDKSIKKVLVIGSGPIVIGQAAEFDYSGTQACQAIKDEGIDVVLVNSNPATIMTDRGMATNTYIEPLTAEYVEKIIQKERPDSIIAGMGGQTGLNLACELYDKGVFEKYNMKVIGTSIPSIKEGEDRDSFKRLMERTNQPIAPSEIVTDVESGLAFAKKIGYPVIVRPAYTLGGTGGGIAEDPEQLETILSQGLHLSRVGQVLLEKSIKGWKEIEFEVMRDGAGNCITVCSMENIDPVGVHTGDSIVVAPALTLADKEYQMLRKAAIDIENMKIAQENTRKNLQVQYLNATNDLMNNQRNFKKQKDNYLLAEDVYAVTMNRYREGITSMTEVLQDEMRMSEAQNNYISAHYNYRITTLMLLKLTGRIDSLVND